MCGIVGYTGKRQAAPILLEGLEKLEYRGVTWYFIDNEYYFGRDRAYGYFDDGERMAFFSRAIVAIWYEDGMIMS